MPVFFLAADDVQFPPAGIARSDGLLAVGGDLSVPRLLSAYSRGIFPWYDTATPILWWSPDPRLVLFPDNLHISRSLKRLLRSSPFKVTLNKDFPKVISHCARALRPNQGGTWIVQAMINAYIHLHQAGKAHSVEVWQQDRLVGGLYGVCIGSAFFGESMFHLVPDASKAALAWLVPMLRQKGCRLIDCQQDTPHLRSFGAEPLDRKTFLRLLSKAVQEPDIL